jgi:DNA-binding Lrp family transcriptional regulator
MSIVSYVLVKIYSGKDREVHKAVINLTQVTECTLVYGEYDMILKVKVQDFNKLDELIFDTLRKIDGVESTKTLIGTRKIK